MDPTVLSTIVAVLALAIAAYALFQLHRRGVTLTGENITTTLQDSTVLASELAEAGLTAARAAEQLYRTGKITRDARLDYAFNYVKKWFPDLDQESILTSIEAGVLMVNALQRLRPPVGGEQLEERVEELEDIHSP